VLFLTLLVKLTLTRVCLILIRFLIFSILFNFQLHDVLPEWKWRRWDAFVMLLPCIFFNALKNFSCMLCLTYLPCMQYSTMIFASLVCSCLAYFPISKLHREFFYSSPWTALILGPYAQHMRWLWANSHLDFLVSISQRQLLTFSTWPWGVSFCALPLTKCIVLNYCLR